jgi:hypothetical protein
MQIESCVLTFKERQKQQFVVKALKFNYYTKAYKLLVDFQLDLKDEINNPSNLKVLFVI